MEKQKQAHSGTTDRQVSEREVIHGRLAREAAAEGMVLLKNEGLLPLDVSVPTALLGGGAVKTVKGGTGSGDVNSRKTISLYEGMKENGALLVSTDWLDAYEKCYAEARETWKKRILEEAGQMENPFDAYAANPFVLPQGRPITDEDVEGAGAAVYVLSRISGEGRDRRREEGDYYISRREREDLLFLSGKKIPTVLVLNTGGVVELTDILREAAYIRAVLFISQPGQEGGRAAADVLYGRAIPGGRLTATWAERYGDYPCADSFGYLNGDIKKEEYREGIFVGYRYFDSFGVKPYFPFGYGLSYTSFRMISEEVKVRDGSMEICVNVKNTGSRYPGREVVQVYVTLPQTGRKKEYHRLAGFAKTPLLSPGESCRVRIGIEQKQLACFSEEKKAWLIEEGSYGVWIGRHSGSLFPAAYLHVSENMIIENTSSICPVQEAFAELEWDGRVQDHPNGSFVQEERKIPQYEFTPVKEVKRAAAVPPAFAWPTEDLLPLLYGGITDGTSMLGSAGCRVPGSAGESTDALEEKYDVRPLVMADGPAGLRLRQEYEVNAVDDTVYGTGVLGSLENGFLESVKHHEGAATYYQFCTAFPVGTLLAQTWDRELVKAIGRAIAAEMKEFHVDLWLAPGMNIQRNPLCGRNFEYYSEDPLLSGTIAAAVTQGVQSRSGCGVVIKHFACNNQEDNRMGVDVRISEKALREIYLRGFEIAVKQSAPAAMMSSYNLVNGVHAANSRDLCTVVAREEWGFDGVIMSDWNTTVPEDGSVPWKCAAAGNDIIMPGNTKDARDIRRAYEQGILKEDDIRACAGRILTLVHRLDDDCIHKIR